MTFEVHNKEINSQCAELLVRPLYIQIQFIIIYFPNQSSDTNRWSQFLSCKMSLFSSNLQQITMLYFSQK